MGILIMTRTPILSLLFFLIANISCGKNSLLNLRTKKNVDNSGFRLKSEVEKLYLNQHTSMLKSDDGLRHITGDLTLQESENGQRIEFIYNDNILINSGNPNYYGIEAESIYAHIVLADNSDTNYMLQISYTVTQDNEPKGLSSRSFSILDLDNVDQNHSFTNDTKIDTSHCFFSGIYMPGASVKSPDGAYELTVTELGGLAKTLHIYETNGEHYAQTVNWQLSELTDVKGIKIDKTGIKALGTDDFLFKLQMPLPNEPLLCITNGGKPVMTWDKGDDILKGAFSVEENNFVGAQYIGLDKVFEGCINPGDELKKGSFLYSNNKQYVFGISGDGRSVGIYDVLNLSLSNNSDPLATGGTRFLRSFKTIDSTYETIRLNDNGNVVGISDSGEQVWNYDNPSGLAGSFRLCLSSMGDLRLEKKLDDIRHRSIIWSENYRLNVEGRGVDYNSFDLQKINSPGPEQYESYTTVQSGNQEYINRYVKRDGSGSGKLILKLKDTTHSTEDLGVDDKIMGLMYNFSEWANPLALVESYEAAIMCYDLENDSEMVDNAYIFEYYYENIRPASFELVNNGIEAHFNVSDSVLRSEGCTLEIFTKNNPSNVIYRHRRAHVTKGNNGEVYLTSWRPIIAYGEALIIEPEFIEDHDPQYSVSSEKVDVDELTGIASEAISEDEARENSPNKGQSVLLIRQQTINAEGSNGENSDRLYCKDPRKPNVTNTGDLVRDGCFDDDDAYFPRSIDLLWPKSQFSLKSEENNSGKEECSGTDDRDCLFVENTPFLNEPMVSYYHDDILEFISAKRSMRALYYVDQDGTKWLVNSCPQLWDEQSKTLTDPICAYNGYLSRAMSKKYKDITTLAVLNDLVYNQIMPATYFLIAMGAVWSMPYLGGLLRAVLVSGVFQGFAIASGMAGIFFLAKESIELSNCTSKACRYESGAAIAWAIVDVLGVAGDLTQLSKMNKIFKHAQRIEKAKGYAPGSAIRATKKVMMKEMLGEEFTFKKEDGTTSLVSVKELSTIDKSEKDVITALLNKMYGNKDGIRRNPRPADTCGFGLTGGLGLTCGTTPNPTPRQNIKNKSYLDKLIEDQSQNTSIDPNNQFFFYDEIMNYSDYPGTTKASDRSSSKDHYKVHDSMLYRGMNLDSFDPNQAENIFGNGLESAYLRKQRTDLPLVDVYGHIAGPSDYVVNRSDWVSTSKTIRTAREAAWESPANGADEGTPVIFMINGDSLKTSKTVDVDSAAKAAANDSGFNFHHFNEEEVAFKSKVDKEDIIGILYEKDDDSWGVVLFEKYSDASFTEVEGLTWKEAVDKMLDSVLFKGL